MLRSLFHLIRIPDRTDSVAGTDDRISIFRISLQQGSMGANLNNEIFEI